MEHNCEGELQPGQQNNIHDILLSSKQLNQLITLCLSVGHEY